MNQAHQRSAGAGKAGGNARTSLQQHCLLKRSCCVVRRALCPSAGASFARLGWSRAWSLPCERRTSCFAPQSASARAACRCLSCAPLRTCASACAAPGGSAHQRPGCAMVTDAAYQHRLSSRHSRAASGAPEWHTAASAHARRRRLREQRRQRVTAAHTARWRRAAAAPAWLPLVRHGPSGGSPRATARHGGAGWPRGAAGGCRARAGGAHTGGARAAAGVRRAPRMAAAIRCAIAPPLLRCTARPCARMRPAWRVQSRDETPEGRGCDLGQQKLPQPPPALARRAARRASRGVRHAHMRAQVPSCGVEQGHERCRCGVGGRCLPSRVTTSLSVTSRGLASRGALPWRGGAISARGSLSGGLSAPSASGSARETTHQRRRARFPPFLPFQGRRLT